MTNETIRIEYVPMAEVQRWPRNPKNHKHELIEESIGRFGFVQPLLLDEGTKQLVAGHGRLETLGRLHKEGGTPPGRIQVGPDGEWLVPVIRGVSFKDEREAEAYLLADNRLAEVGGWDDAGLQAILTDLNTDELLKGVGWSSKQVEELLDVGGAAEAYVGPTLDEELDVYKAGEIKQIVLYFEAAAYEKVLGRLKVLMEAEHIGNHTEMFEKLLEAYEASRSQPA